LLGKKSYVVVVVVVVVGFILLIQSHGINLFHQYTILRSVVQKYLPSVTDASFYQDKVKKIACQSMEGGEEVEVPSAPIWKKTQHQSAENHGDAMDQQPPPAKRQENRQYPNPLASGRVQ